MFLTWSYFDFHIFSDTDLSNILGDPLLQVCTWYSELRGLAWSPFCPVLSAMKCTVQWVRVGHTCFLYWPLPGRARTDLFCNSQYEEAEKQWRWWEAVEHLFKSVFIVSKVDTLCDLLLHTARVHCCFLLTSLWSIDWRTDWMHASLIGLLSGRLINPDWSTDRPNEQTADESNDRLTFDRYWFLRNLSGTCGTDWTSSLCWFTWWYFH